MVEKEQLLITSDGNPPDHCSDYDIESGRCKSSGQWCDACYEDSLKTSLLYD